MATAKIIHEYPSCVHVRVDGAKSARVAVAVARIEASRHYGQKVGHYVSSGGGWDGNGNTHYTYVFENPITFGRVLV